MPSVNQINAHRKIQDCAKAVLDQLPYLLTPEDNEQTIAVKAHRLLSQMGYPKTWYYDCPALVLLGSRTCLSVSGRHYVASEERLGLTNLVTVDLSPMEDGTWGDCARSIIFEAGSVTAQPKTLEFRNGLRFQSQLQQHLLEFVTPATSYGDLFNWANVRIRESGFVNLDFRHNVGHGIAGSREDRQFIQANNETLLSQTPFFSFEPFVRLKGGNWGFKHEDIFFFNEQMKLERL
jgi:Xaa-Pro aminopeptidase